MFPDCGATGCGWFAHGIPRVSIKISGTHALNRLFCGGIGAPFTGSPAGAARLRPSSTAELLRPRPATELAQLLPQREPFGRERERSDLIRDGQTGNHFLAESCSFQACFLQLERSLTCVTGRLLQIFWQEHFRFSLLQPVAAFAIVDLCDRKLFRFFRKASIFSTVHVGKKTLYRQC